jgi:hypothetical protein
MLGSPKWSLSLSFPHRNPVYASSSPTPATLPAHLSLDFITRTIQIGVPVRGQLYT